MTALALCSILIAACGGAKESPSVPTAPTDTPSPPSTPSTGVALNDDFSGRALFPADNWWNQDVSRAPLDSQSNAFIDYIGRHARCTLTSVRRRTAFRTSASAAGRRACR